MTMTKSQTASWGFGTSSRPRINQTSISPGPNIYDIPSKLNEGPKYGMGLRTIDITNTKRDYIPGPGKYDTSTADYLNSKMKAEPSFSMGTGQRADLANIKEVSKMPGPGNYDGTHDTKKNAPHYGFGTSNRDNSTEAKLINKVGPGAYDIGSLVGKEGAHSTIHSKLNDNF